MGRWQPDGQGRLGQAAMELFAERGFEHVTVAQIAAHAGLTSRTFYRYFIDKQEVLFSGFGLMNETLSRAVDDAALPLSPLAVVADALASVARLVGPDHAHLVRRRAIIRAYPELQERELGKLATWSRCLADGLLRKGVDERSANLAAETGTAVFRCAYEEWTAHRAGPELVDILSQSFKQLQTLIETSRDGASAGPVPPTSPLRRRRRG